jgi:hypothetical protein
MPAQAQETEKDMPFPLQGIDLSQGHAYQRPLTCETGVNVRAFEPISNRARGGSRSGLSKYLPAQVPAGTHLIQHLNTVDPSVDSALLDWNLPWPDFTMPTGISLPPITWGIPDPDPADVTVATMDDPSTGARNPGRLVPVGGTGIAPNRNKPADDPDIEYRQSAFLTINTYGAGVSVPISLPLPDVIALGDLILFGIHYTVGGEFSPGGEPSSVGDTLGNTYTLISDDGYSGEIPYPSDPDFFFDRRMALYYAVATHAGACSLTALQADLVGYVQIGLAGAVFRHTKAPPPSGLPLDGASSFTSGDGFGTDWSTGTIPVNHARELAIGLFSGMGSSTIQTFVPGDFTVLGDPDNVGLGLYEDEDFNLFFMYRLPRNSAIAITGTLPVDDWTVQSPFPIPDVNRAMIGIGASFRSNRE